jgi:hypothetical protein
MRIGRETEILGENFPQWEVGDWPPEP